MNFNQTHSDYTAPGVTAPVTTRVLWEQGKLGHAEERALFNNGEISECEFEFGPHGDHSECEWLMAEMSGDLDYIDWDADLYNREAEEMMLGRPLFPNEY